MRRMLSFHSKAACCCTLGKINKVAQEIGWGASVGDRPSGRREEPRTPFRPLRVVQLAQHLTLRVKSLCRLGQRSRRNGEDRRGEKKSKV